MQAKSYFRESRIDEIVDPGIKGGYYAEAMWRVMEVALSCIESYAAYRPCMIDIVRELADALIIENNASECMKSIDSLTTSTHFNSNRNVAYYDTSPVPSAAKIVKWVNVRCFINM